MNSSIVHYLLFLVRQSFGGMGVLIAALFLSGIPAKAGPVVYWADLAAENGNRIDLTTGQNETFQIQSQDVASSFASPALAIDETNGEVLTTYNRFKDGILTEFIIRMNADGSGVEELVELDRNRESIRELALSEAAQRIYWIETGETASDPNFIKSSAMDGNDMKTLASVEGGDSLSGLVVDDQREKILFIRNESSVLEVRRMNPDGSEMETAVDGFFIAINDLALLENSNTLYWSISGWKGIKSLPLDAGGRGTVSATDATTRVEDSAAQPLRQIVMSQADEGILLYIEGNDMKAESVGNAFDPQAVATVETGATLAIDDAGDIGDGDREEQFMTYFDGEISATEGSWGKVPWFSSGWMYFARFPWVLHQDHGWVYLSGEGGQQVWFYDELHEWMYVYSNAPNFYWSDEAGWLYHLPGSTKPGDGRWFYGYDRKHWFTGSFQSPEISLNDQASIDGRILTVNRVVLPQGGFIAIHDGPPLDTNTSVLGVSTYLDSGSHENINVVLDSSLSEGSSQVTGTIHMDTNDNVIFDFLTSDGQDDTPYLSNGSPVTATASIQVSGLN